MSWRKGHVSEVGTWSEADRIAYAVAPNYAGAERVFSLLKTLLGSNQETTLPDKICGSVILRYSNTKRANGARKKS